MLATQVWTTIAHLAFFFAALRDGLRKKRRRPIFYQKSDAEFRTSVVGTAWQGPPDKIKTKDAKEEKYSNS